MEAVPWLTVQYAPIDWSDSRHHDTLETAMQREKIKNWKRAWKIELIEKNNPHWNDLYPSTFVRTPRWVPA